MQNPLEMVPPVDGNRLSLMRGGLHVAEFPFFHINSLPSGAGSG